MYIILIFLRFAHDYYWSLPVPKTTQQYRKKRWKESDVSKLLDELNTYDDDGEDDKGNSTGGVAPPEGLPMESHGRIHPGPMMGKCVVKYALMAKSHFGVLPRTTANRMSVRRWVRDKMIEGGLRPSHISGHIELSTNLVFIRTIAEIQAEYVMTTQSSVSADDEWNSIRRGSRRWWKPWTYNNRVLTFETI